MFTKRDLRAREGSLSIFQLSLCVCKIWTFLILLNGKQNFWTHQGNSESFWAEYGLEDGLLLLFTDGEAEAQGG